MKHLRYSTPTWSQLMRSEDRVEQILVQAVTALSTVPANSSLMIEQIYRRLVKAVEKEADR